MDELGDDHWVLFGHCHRTAQELLQVAVTVGHVHGGAAQHVGGPDQAGVTNRLTELDCRLEEQNDGKKIKVKGIVKSGILNLFRTPDTSNIIHQ